jgi:hypothetical protein
MYIAMAMRSESLIAVNKARGFMMGTAQALLDNARGLEQSSLPPRDRLPFWQDILGARRAADDVFYQARVWDRARHFAQKERQRRGLAPVQARAGRWKGHLSTCLSDCLSGPSVHLSPAPVRRFVRPSVHPRMPPEAICLSDGCSCLLICPSVHPFGHSVSQV